MVWISALAKRLLRNCIFKHKEDEDGSLVSRCNFRCAGNGVVRLLTLHKFEFRKVNLLPLCATSLKEVFRCKNRHYFYCSVLFCVLPVPVPSGTLITEAAATLT